MKKLSLLLHQIIVFFPRLRWMSNSRIRVQFKESCLKQNNIRLTPKNVVNLFIIYELDTWSRYLKTLFYAVKLPLLCMRVLR